MSEATSARGLFRATGNKPKPVPARLLDGSYVLVEHLEREEDDFYPTPPEPIRALLSVEGSRLAAFSQLWEPAAGDGALVRELERAGFDTIASDLIDRGCNAEIRSFYDYSEAPSEAIVTNPPFSECNRSSAWCRHALDTLDVSYMALLLPFNWPGAAERGGLWARKPPARVYLMRWRIDFTGQGAPPMLNAWFVWDKLHVGETVLRMLDRKDPQQSELFPEEAARVPEPIQEAML